MLGFDLVMIIRWDRTVGPGQRLQLRPRTKNSLENKARHKIFLLTGYDLTFTILRLPWDQGIKDWVEHSNSLCLCSSSPATWLIMIGRTDKCAIFKFANCMAYQNLGV